MTFETETDLFRSCFLRFAPCWSLLQIDILSARSLYLGPDWEEERPALVSFRWGCQGWPRWEGTDLETWRGLWPGWRWLEEMAGTDNFWKVQGEIKSSPSLPGCQVHLADDLSGQVWPGVVRGGSHQGTVLSTPGSVLQSQWTVSKYGKYYKLNVKWVYKAKFIFSSSIV